MTSSPQKVLLIGHRGVGKSSFLRRLRSYFSNDSNQFFDLDLEIEKRANKSVSAIFSEHGEQGFRELEQAELENLKKLPGRVWVAAGAGLNLQALEGWRVIWLQRESDNAGRIFLNRPRLQPELKPLEEYFARKVLRDPLYQASATETLWLEEGLEKEDAFEKALLQGKLKNLRGALTVLPHWPQSEARVRSLSKYLEMGVQYLELRNDLLKPKAIDFWLKQFSRHHDQILFSFRDPKRTDQSLQRVTVTSVTMDWADELGPPPGSLFPHIISFHSPNMPFDQAFKRADVLTRLYPGMICKWSPEVNNWSDLEKGEQWRRQDLAHRCFLPRSQSGRWVWYRLLTKQQQPLQFWREGSGSAPDQPSLLAWARCAGSAKFAAILGQPVNLSRTPLEQYEFMRERGLDVLPIDISESEWENGGVEFLRNLGLRYAAVTAPLKRQARQLCQEVDAEGKKHNAVNTIFYSEKKKLWIGTNTDTNGLARAWQQHSEQKADDIAVAVWGGGGTHSSIQKIFPKAIFFSSRTGQAKEVLSEDYLPEVLVWAVGREAFAKLGVFPPQKWAPKIIFDLNYTDNSPGLEYAQKISATYISGLSMFLAQAEAQREFWSMQEKEVQNGVS